MGRGCTRESDRIASSLGKMSEAAVEFCELSDVSFGGVLLSLPALLANGLLVKTKEYFSLPRGYYGIRSIFIILSFLVLLRLKSLEGIRYISPGEMGKLVGLDRIPEVRTMREKMDIFVQRGRVNQWQTFLSKSWMESSGDLSGALYVDGHVRVYHGKQTKLPRRYIARLRLCLRGTTDYWVNDALGQPFFVVSTPLTDGLLSMLRTTIVPRLLQEVPNQPDEEALNQNPLLHRFMIIFDREGYSPDFFLEMLKVRIACITYKKYPGEDWPDEEFTEKEVTLKNGEKVTMKLAERGTLLGEKVWAREIRKLTNTGHQTAIICTDYVSEGEQIAAAMFTRWSQENFFKYMVQNFGIDRLIEYQTEAIDETAKVVNPPYRNIESKIKSLNSKLSRRLAQFGALTLDLIDEKNIKKYNNKKIQLQEEITFLQKELNELKEKRNEISKYITLGELPEQEKFTKLTNEKKQILDTIKMIAYRAETALANILRSKMSKKDEAKSFVRQIFNTEIDLKPNIKTNTLEVSLHNLTNQYSDKIAHYLCDKLNETETVFPGTNLRLVYKLVANYNHRPPEV